MAFREVPMLIREVLRLWLAGEGLRAVARLCRVDRKTVRVDGPSYRQRQRPGQEPHPSPPGGGPAPSSRPANTAAGVKAKPSGRPPAGLDSGSSRPRRRRS